MLDDNYTVKNTKKPIKTYYMIYGSVGSFYIHERS
ncbi:MAG: hypothetical protein H6Q20_629 [Bacteroidetes bacterium]|nr:hypothetical protein [Bacteroidota bacterium]